MRTQPTESALLVEVPAAKPAVGGFRARLDRSAGWGVPPHLTVLFPFVAPDALTPGVHTTVAATVAGHPAFDLVLDRVCWFGDDVVWLAPADPAPLQGLTAAVVARFPDHPPYGGSIADPVPHLTIGQLGSLTDRRAAAAAVARCVPVRQPVTTVALWVGAQRPGGWRRVAQFPLAPRPGGQTTTATGAETTSPAQQSGSAQR